MFKIKHGSPCKNKKAITFYQDARLRPIIYQIARNRKRKLWENLNGCNF